MNEQDIYIEAMNLQDNDQRHRFLDDVCGTNRTLRARVKKLIQHADRVGSFLESSPLGVGLLNDDSYPDSETANAQIGPYRLIEPLGKGGFGTVYLAEQTEPIQRRVALKVIKLGMDTREVVARFEAERQALAMMDHSNIAKVLDAGATETGRPYFVMELVQGEPITAYCDRANLTTKARLELFIDVCHAVQHAHQRGIIHRDIKPTNVMVTQQDGRAVPKVIDFGIAKAIHHRLTERTFSTGCGRLIGTPQYMSPEQAQLTDVDVDTRTDVYSLGVLLYELLTGTTPFEPEQLAKAGCDEVCRIIRETDPPIPSKRLSTLKDATTEVGKRRQAQPAVLRKLLRGDLDWIVMKAIEKDRTDRYASPQDMADDLRRFLDDNPIRAQRATFLERMIRKSRRHRAAVVTAGIVLTVVVVGSIVSAALLWNEQRETDEALVVAPKERETAKQKAEEAEAITEFLVKDLLGSVDPKNAKGREVTVKEVVANAEAKIGAAFRDKPLTEAAIRQTLARVLFHLGRYTDARSHAERARELRTAILGAKHLDTLKATSDLAKVLSAQGDLEEARKLNEQVLTVCRRTLGPDDPITLGMMNRAACDLQVRGELEAARTLHEEVLAARRRILGADHEDTLESMNNLAIVFARQRKLKKAHKLFEEALEARRRILGPDHPATCVVMHNLAMVCGNENQLDRARELYEEILEVQRRILGPDHPDTLHVMNGLAIVLKSLGELEAARQLHEQALEAKRRILGLDHPHTLGTMNNLAIVLSDQGKLEEARKLHEQALEARQRALGPDHPSTLGAMYSLATTLHKQDKLKEARKLIEQALEAQRRVLGPDHFDTLRSKGALAWVLCEEGELEEARKLHEQVLEAKRRTLGPNHRNTLDSMHLLALVLFKQNELEKAYELCEYVVETRWQTLGPCHLDTLDAVEDLIEIRVRQKGSTEAPKLSENSNESLRGDEDIAPNIFYLATAHWHLGDEEAARRWYDKAVEWMDKHKPNDKDLARFRDEAAKLITIEGEDKSGED